MPSPEAEGRGGPDGSSIKPVSSLLARFENMNSLPVSNSNPPSHPNSRPISPSPKPDKLRSFKSHQDASPTNSTGGLPARAIDTEGPKPTFVPGPKIERNDVGAKAQPPSKPPVAAKPQLLPLKPPAVNVMPPQSPPKKDPRGLNNGDQSPFLNPEAVYTPSTPGASGKPSSPMSRPMTPTPSLPPPRSPRLGASQPPSPPPPRRSAELRRDRETKQAPPPPAPRVDRVNTAALKPSSVPEDRGKYFPHRDVVSAGVSPFNSPPLSPQHGEGDEAPPELPTRPNARAPVDATSGMKSALGGYEPPPTHHAVANRRKVREPESNGLRQLPPNDDDAPPNLPTRPRAAETQGRPSVEYTSRPTIGAARSTTQPIDIPRSVPGPKRVASNPAETQQLLPPTRTHGRSKTLDAMSERPSPALSNTIPATTKTAKSHLSNALPSKADTAVTGFPDVSCTNRRPPFMGKTCHEVSTKYDPRIFDVCGGHVCTSGQMTRIWNIVDGDMLASFNHTEGVKATAVSFKPSLHPQDGARKLWVGTNLGELMEIDVATKHISLSRGNAHTRAEVTRIYQHRNEMWTIDEGGTLLVWGPDEDGLPSLDRAPTQSFKMPRGHTFSMIVNDELWHATGREIRIFAPTLDGKKQFQVLIRPITVEGASDITSGTILRSQPDKVFLGHADGKVSIISTKDYTCVSVLHVSSFKINSLAAVGPYMWAAFNTGRISVYDVGVTPWITMKEWQAHDNPVIRMRVDDASAYLLNRIQVISLGADSKVKIWDGLLPEDWIEDEMKARDTNYCSFQEIKAMVFTWNAGASTPHSLRYSDSDANFFPSLLKSSESPDILIFGFQELVDLEDKAATAKRFLKSSKKKDGSDQEKMSHQYRDWRDFLLKSLDDYMPADDLYHLLHTAPMVGLFTCVFIKSSLRDRVRNLVGAEVKRGMGGLHGNKGAVLVRFQVDDTSLCFVNCHLAAGQSQVASRNNDIACILEENVFPSERHPDTRLDCFTGGGDGSLVTDHELCIINGDLNYRIDTMSRDTVVTALKQKNLQKLLERDQLLVARRRMAGFRLRAFEELPITFHPTYKYDVGTDTYDTSEKRRSPAWCDRLLYRGRGRVRQLDYQRHEVRVSDHRPVTGNFRLWVKKVDKKSRAVAMVESQKRFEAVQERELSESRLHYLTRICGYDEATSKDLIQERLRNRRLPG